MTTFLLKLDPIGLGTEEVESLTSFQSRLAASNGLTPRQLSGIVKRVRAYDEAADPARDRRVPRPPTDARSELDLLAELSGSPDLTRLTFLPLSSDGCSPRNTSLRTARAWCEQCFVEDRKRMRPAFDRLIWTSRFMMRCPFHKVLLRTICPRCTQPHTVYSKGDGSNRGQLDQCIHCKASLVGPDRLVRPEFRPFFGEAEVQEIVGAISAGDLTRTNASCLAEFYGALDHEDWPDEGAHSELAPTIPHWNIPTIANIVGTACKYQVSAVSLIRTPRLAAEQASRFAFESQFVPGRARIKAEGLLLQSIRTTLESGLLAPPDHPIPTLAQVGAMFYMRDLGFSQLFPDLTDEYLKRTRRQAARILMDQPD
ncbi:TniQ family protein [Stenotrophomonas sp. S41]|nr:TniQ family protein [Stenotrophomonas sp. S41]